MGWYSLVIKSSRHHLCYYFSFKVWHFSGALLQHNETPPHNELWEVKGFNYTICQVLCITDRQLGSLVIHPYILYLIHQMQKWHLVLKYHLIMVWNWLCTLACFIDLSKYLLAASAAYVPPALRGKARPNKQVHLLLYIHYGRGPHCYKQNTLVSHKNKNWKWYNCCMVLGII